jgi:hypothetical protein
MLHVHSNAHAHMPRMLTRTNTYAHILKALLSSLQSGVQTTCANIKKEATKLTAEMARTVDALTDNLKQQETEIFLQKTQIKIMQKELARLQALEASNTHFEKLAHELAMQVRHRRCNV